MKTNLASIMTRLSLLTTDFFGYKSLVNEAAFNEKVIELTGKEQMLKEYEDFQERFDKMLDAATEITKLKGILNKKNGEFKLSDGRTIQEALIDISTTRSIIETLERLSNLNESKQRVTETNNSYFMCKELNYDKKVMKEHSERLREMIEKTEFEISKLNAVEFEIE